MSNSFEVNQSVSSDLINCVFNNIPDTITTKLEKAIAMYVILCRNMILIILFMVMLIELIKLVMLLL